MNKQIFGIEKEFKVPEGANFDEFTMAITGLIIATYKLWLSQYGVKDDDHTIKEIYKG